MDQAEPADWFVIFQRQSSRWWIDLLAWGEFRHVCAMGYVPRCSTWLVFDWQIGKTRIFAVANAEADALLGHYSAGSVIVRMPKQFGAENRYNPRLGGWCVPSVAHLLGLRTCALRPDALFRHCLANGGEIVAGDDESSTTR
jgi:hypothetical protein